MTSLKSPVTAILTGPTATGKSKIAIDFCQRHPEIEIINADSIIIYKKFNIGSAKPTLAERQGIPHHLIDCAEPLDNFSAADFLNSTHKILAELHAKNRRGLIVGGTGFYLKALCFGIWEAPPTQPELRLELEHEDLAHLFLRLQQLDPVSAQRIGPKDRYRLTRAIEICVASGKTVTEISNNHPNQANPAFPLLVIDRDPVALENRLQSRIEAMFQLGWLEETQELLGQYPHAKALDSVGYREIKNFLKGIQPEGRRPIRTGQDLLKEVVLSHRQLAKKQRKWFKTQKNALPFVLDRDLTLLNQQLEELYR